MRAVRFGSYSTAATFAGTANFSRRKSMRRYWRLCPPPIYRLVMCPLLLRPPVRLSGSSSDFSGSVFVMSAKSETERKRVAGVIGRNCRMPISALEHLDGVALFEGDDRLLPGRPPAGVAPVRLALGAHDQGPHARHGNLEQRLDRGLDLRLARLEMHLERVFLAGAVGCRRLLGDHRCDDHGVQVRHRPPPLPSPPWHPGPGAPPAPRATRGSRTPWRRRTASRARRGCCGPTGTRSGSSRRPPSAPAPSCRSAPASRAGRRTVSSSASRRRTRPPPAPRPRGRAR